eukprot:TRINITY_DN4149_c0_g1_i1.p1 TRINITY_DN4149_c0_g1~~TRINITY_DN4149_c0_g1_i1.p1  ORF type:complete len:296 (+),score=115.13 TRINITY_DN4149_c0_g1_i1:135-1022(+)
MFRSRIARRWCHAVDMTYVTVKPGAPIDGLEPFVVLHGMLGNMHNWRTPARMLAEKTGRVVHCVDMRNHGRSPHADAMTFNAVSNDILQFLDSDVVEGDKAVLVGHSLGGKGVMHAALKAPERFVGQVVADISPICYASSGRKEASHSFNFIQYLLDMDDATKTDLAKADAYLAAAGVTDKGVRAFLLTNLARCSKTKTAQWRPNLQVLHDSIDDGTLVGFETNGFEESAVPTLIMTGGRSPYVNMERDGAAFSKYFPNNSHHSLPGAGHWLHAEEPGAFTDAVASWVKGGYKSV